MVSFNYKLRSAYIKFFGTHAEYDRVDATVVDHTSVIHAKAKR
ncbi:MAG: type II toxin-antitoxin system HigB family toxin [Burkholderiales bacterium]